MTRVAPPAMTLALCVAHLMACGSSRPPGPQAPANVLLISIDTLRADHLGAYGYARETSPRIDRLAEEGVIFETAVAETSWTLPSHATLLTGLSSSVHGVFFDGARLGDDVSTLAEILRSRGYRTEAIVSAPYVHPIFGFGQGFDAYDVIGDSVYDDPSFSHERLARDSALRARFEAQEMALFRARSSDEIARRVDRALDRLAGSPFFLFVHLFDPHSDYDPPEPYWRRFNPDYAGDFDPRGYLVDPAVRAGLPREDLLQILALYDGEIRWTDEHVGRMLDALRESELEDDTLVVLVSDHGEEFFEHGSKGHRKTLYDEQLLVPLVFRLPGFLPAGRRLSMQVRMLDVAPTILDAVGMGGGSLMGESLLPYVFGERRERDLPALSLLLTNRALVQALREGDTKLVVTRPAGSAAGESSTRFELFDLRKDPEERIPILRGPAFDAARRAFAERLEHEDAMRRRLGGGGATPVVVPPEMRRQLEDLGYVEER